jgi:CDGSH-type Zn-finger protein
VVDDRIAFTKIAESMDRRAMTEVSTEPVVQLTVQPDGPYVVTGGVPVSRRRAIESELGEPLTRETTERFPTRPSVALCRCGESANKPFCDGTHARSGFDGTEAAPESTYDERARTFQGVRVVVRDDREICEHAGFCGNHVTNVWKMIGGPATVLRNGWAARQPVGRAAVRGAQPRDAVPVRRVGDQAVVRRNTQVQRLRRPLTRTNRTKSTMGTPT